MVLKCYLEYYFSVIVILMSMQTRVEVNKVLQGSLSQPGR